MLASDRQNGELDVVPDEHGGFHGGKIMWVDELAEKQRKQEAYAWSRHI